MILININIKQIKVERKNIYMINVVDNYKKVNMVIDGKERVERLDEKPWNVVTIENEGEKITAEEGDQVEFVVDSGEVISGVLSKITSSNEKTKLQVKLFGSEREQICPVTSINEGTFKVVKTED